MSTARDRSANLPLTRRRTYSLITLDDPEVSRIHLRLYAISSENDAVPTLIYAQNMSRTSGTLLRRFSSPSSNLGGSVSIFRDGFDKSVDCVETRLRGGDPAALLNDGDELRLGSSCWFRYAELNRMDMEEGEMGTVMRVEKKVRLPLTWSTTCSSQVAQHSLFSTPPT